VHSSSEMSGLCSAQNSAGRGSVERPAACSMISSARCVGSAPQVSQANGLSVRDMPASRWRDARQICSSSATNSDLRLARACGTLRNRGRPGCAMTPRLVEHLCRALSWYADSDSNLCEGTFPVADTSRRTSSHLVRTHQLACSVAVGGADLASWAARRSQARSSCRAPLSRSRTSRLTLRCLPPRDPGPPMINGRHGAISLHPVKHRSDAPRDADRE
jgi:hypothetical protein